MNLHYHYIDSTLPLQWIYISITVNLHYHYGESTLPRQWIFITITVNVLCFLLILVPIKPRDFKATGGSQSIGLQWSLPPPTNDVITIYHICYVIILSDGKQVPGVEKCTTALATASTHNFKNLGSLYFSNICSCMFHSLFR